MVTVILREARVFDLLLRNEITRMPVVPTANHDDHPEMIEVSSSDDDGDEVEEPDDDPTSPPARGSRMDQTSGETDAGGDDIEIDEDEEDMGGQPSEAKKRRTEVRNIRDQFEKMIAEASIVHYCFMCGGTHDIEECPMQDDEHMKDTLMAYENDHGGAIKIPIFLREIQNSDQGQKRQAPEERYHAGGEAMEKNEIH